MLRRHAVLAINDNTQRLTQVLLRIKRLVSAFSSSQRTVMAGSSARTVSLLVRIAWLCARRRCTSRLACGDVIHWLSPFAIAVRPSSEAPSLLDIREPGTHALQETFVERFRVLHHQAMADVNAFLLQTIQTSSRHLRIRVLHRCNHARHPAAISASQHGGVRP